MSKHNNIKTTISQIVDYWARRVDECYLSVDWCDAETHCWRCGCERTLERCHIVPRSLGGEDAPHNLVLLCKRCHADGPNVSDPEIMWDWIKAYKTIYYETFWKLLGLKEYEFIYGARFFHDLDTVVKAAGLEMRDSITSEVECILKSFSRKFSYHYGQPYLNVATIAGIYRMVLKQFAKNHNVEISVCKSKLY